MNKILLLSIPLLFSVLHELHAQSSVVYESGGTLISEQAAFNVHFYDLDLTVNPADSSVGGSVGVHFDMVHPSNVIALDLDPRLQLRDVLWIEEGVEKSLQVERSDTSKTFFVTFPETLQPGRKSAVEVHYHGKPRVGENPPWDGGMVWARTPSGEPWVGVAVQTIGAWTWWPNKDHPTDKADSVAINLTMPDNLVVASNGRDRGVSEAGAGWKTWHWFVSNPISNYNVTLNAAPYETITDTYTSVTGEEVDLIFWILPEYREQGEWLFPQFEKQLRFLEGIVGPYPFRADKYGVAHAPYLGMEHQTLIAYGASFENDNLFGLNAGYDDLHQHELAHEWWGNLVSAWDWRDFWIHEGIGTYMQPLYAEYLAGGEAYREMMELFRNRISSRREVAPRQNMSSLEITQGGRGGDVYYKGAWFMHTLRYVIGDDHFFKVLRRFAYPTEEMEKVTSGEQVRFATTDDLLHLAERITGMELEWLFEIYLRQPHLPKLQMNRSGHLVELEWRVPEGYDFPMPVELMINGEGVTLMPENGRISVEVPESAAVEVDPHNWILKEFSIL